MKALALDFDGVISDSAPEAFSVALRTLAALRPLRFENPGSPLSSSLALATRVPAVELQDIRAAPAYAAFVEHMPLGNRAEDFGAVLLAIHEGRPLPDQAAYDAHRASLSAEFLAEYHARFYVERERFREAEPARWRRLLAPYPEFLDLLRRRSGDVILAIATAKDRPSVDELLLDYGVADLVPPELRFDKETGVEKGAHLEALQRACGLDFDAISFVDDKVNHLEKVSALGVRCVLAGWGYNGPRERARAQACGFLVCDLKDVEAQLFA